MFVKQKIIICRCENPNRFWGFVLRDSGVSGFRVLPLTGGVMP